VLKEFLGLLFPIYFCTYSALLFLIQSLNLEEKWVGAPFAAMLRRHQVDYSEQNDCVLKIVFVLLSASSNVTQVKYSSINLQVKIRQCMLIFSLCFLKLICCSFFLFSFFFFFSLDF
jgi:hypothetical protein